MRKEKRKKKEKKMKKKNEERTQQQWEKCSQVEIQQESPLQVNTPPHQLIGKEYGLSS